MVRPLILLFLMFVAASATANEKLKVSFSCQILIDDFNVSQFTLVSHGREDNIIEEEFKVFEDVVIAVSASYHRLDYNIYRATEAVVEAVQRVEVGESQQLPKEDHIDHFSETFRVGWWVSFVRKIIYSEKTYIIDCESWI